MIQDILWHEGLKYPDLVKGGAQGVIDGKVVYAAGMNYPWRESDRTFFFDPSATSPSWEELPPLPRGCCYTQGVSVGDEFFVIGGRRQLQSLSECYKLTKNDGVWRWEDIPNLKQARAVPVLTAVGSLIICIGGGEWNREKPGAFFPQNITLVEAFDTHHPERGWFPFAPFPGRLRAGASCASASGKVYLFGGYHAWIENDQRKVERLKDAFSFDPITNQWESVADLPYPLSGGTAVYTDERYVAILGGALQLEDGSIYHVEKFEGLRNVTVGEYSDRVWIYDVANDSYQELPSRMQHGANDIRACSINEAIYVVGGENIDKTTSNTTNIFQIGNWNEVLKNGYVKRGK